MTPRRFAITSRLAASPAQVWSVVSTMSGVNAELAPFLRMTHPPGLDRLERQEVPLGTPLFRSWLLLFGLLPIDFDHLVLTRIESNVGFREESTMASARLWVHERTLKQIDGGCEVEDRLEYWPRIRLTAPLHHAFVVQLFRHRHRRLRARFGALL